MNISTILAMTFLLIPFLAVTYGEISKEDIAGSIDIKGLKHPYLVFSDQDKAAILARIAEDRESGDIMKGLLAEGNRLIHQPVDLTIPAQGKNTRGDWSEQDRDNKYERYYRSNIENALTLAFLYQMTGKPKYASKAFEFADAFCDLPTWTMRAHEFPIIYSRVMPWNVPDDQVSFSFDHTNGDSGREMAYVYDWLYPALNQRQRDRIRGALIEKVITRVRGNYEFHWWSTSYRCNWCGVCNSGVGMAGMALLNEHPQLVDVVAESFNRIDRMLNELGVDGGWQEGCGYWSYALRTSTQFAKALKRLTKGKYDLFKNPRLSANPVTFPLYMSVPPDLSIDFADSRSQRIGPTSLINLLAMETNHPAVSWYRNNVLGEGRDLLDIIWPRPAQNMTEPERKSIHFRTIDFWVMRNDFRDPESVIVAGKAGKNDDPHHGHLDIGQVVVFWQGQAFISETGRPFYDEKYFDEARWEYPHASSLGHNLIFVNGEKQISGKLYKQPYNYDVGGKVIEFRSSPDRDYALMDPTGAYPQKELKGWRRHVVFEKPDITLVVDEVACHKGGEIEARFHSQCRIEAFGRYALLKGEQDGAGDSALMALIPVLNNPFTIQMDRHAYLPVSATADLSWIPYLRIVSEAANDRSVIATLILPVQDKQEAEQIASSAALSMDGRKNVTLSFVRKERNFEVQFEAVPDGLVLEK